MARHPDYKRFYQSLNQPTRNARHGKHRRPGKTAHRDPADRAGDGAGGTFTVTWDTKSRRHAQLAPTSQNAGKSTSLNRTGHVPALLGNLKAGNLLTFGWDLGTPAVLLPPVVTTGEIVGYRHWWLIDGYLYSTAHERRWEPGGVMVGDVDKTEGSGNQGGGVYSYNAASHSNHEAAGFGFLLNRLDTHWLTWSISLADRHLFILQADAIVTGTVKLWGQVVEHRHGYRAQFARIASLDAIHAPSYCNDDALRWLEDLRRKYGV